MTYASGSTIDAADYNGLASTNTSNVAYVWGTGSGTYGYGQDTTQIASVSTGATVTAVQWQGLFNCINRVLGHQSGAAARLAGGGNINVAGDTITFFSNVSTAVGTINTNRLLFNNTRGTTTTGTNRDATWNSGTPTSFQQVRNVLFASADQMRYFFNAGGRITLTLTTVSGTDNAKESAWTNMLNNGIGTINIDAQISSRTGTGYTLTTDGFANGFWDLTTTNTTIVRLSDTDAAYTSNYVNIAANVAGPAGSNGGLGRILYLTIDYQDDALDSSYDVGGTTNDTINMTMRTRIDVIRPETTYLTDVWGTITEAANIN